jgi:hypothetical protein
MGEEQIEGAFYSDKTNLHTKFANKLRDLQVAEHNREEESAYRKQLELINALTISILNNMSNY